MSRTNLRLVPRGLRRTALAACGTLLIAEVAGAGVLAVDRWSIDAGGTGYVQAGSLILGGTIGQPDDAIITAVGYAVSGGFWIPGAPIPVGVGGDPDPEPPLGPSPGPPLPPAPPAPRELRIHSAAPNPLQAGTRIALELPAPQRVEAQVFDINGALVRTLTAMELPTGFHALDWDMRDDAGHRVQAGLYFTRIRVGATEARQKLVVLR